MIKKIITNFTARSRLTGSFFMILFTPTCLFDLCIVNIRFQFSRSGSGPRINLLPLDIQEKLKRHTRYCCMCGIGLAGDGSYFRSFTQNVYSEVAFLVWFCSPNCFKNFFPLQFNHRVMID